VRGTFVEGLECGLPRQGEGGGFGEGEVAWFEAGASRGAEAVLREGAMVGGGDAGVDFVTDLEVGDCGADGDDGSR
jgi:hypothetical protein